MILVYLPLYAFIAQLIWYFIWFRNKTRLHLLYHRTLYCEPWSKDWRVHLHGTLLELYRFMILIRIKHLAGLNHFYTIINNIMQSQHSKTLISSFRFTPRITHFPPVSFLSCIVLEFPRINQHFPNKTLKFVEMRHRVSRMEVATDLLHWFSPPTVRSGSMSSFQLADRVTDWLVDLASGERHGDEASDATGREANEENENEFSHQHSFTPQVCRYFLAIHHSTTAAV